MKSTGDTFIKIALFGVKVNVILFLHLQGQGYTYILYDEHHFLCSNHIFLHNNRSHIYLCILVTFITLTFITKMLYDTTKEKLLQRMDVCVTCIDPTLRCAN